MVTAHELNGFHRRIVLPFGEVLGRRVLIQSPEVAPGDLHNLAPGGEANFELNAAGGVRQCAFSKLGDRRSVFPLVKASHDDDPYLPRCWVGWHEVWRCTGKKNNLDLREASWELYWGRAEDERMTQVVRAEWDQIHRLESSKSSAGHPHWHVDTEIILPSLEMQPVPGEIESGYDDTQGTLSIQKMHLAMGGWRNRKSIDVPDCWQCDFEGSTDELAEWGERTLKYLQSQSGLIVKR